MKRSLQVLALIAAFISTSVFSGDLVLVEENHAKIEKDGVIYIFDSYIVMFQQPYYILVQREDKKPINLEQVEPLAVEYILPRGCTGPLQRRPDLDQHNENNSKLLIGIAC
ncbi:hypothetical protein HF888_08830 [Bermanella marisrubri]|uniref:Uncharacterized protein n=1 Tax=Bermanella marisrubri TaxID=207949 RepID=Q1N6R1_9GAMM|nr:hypothetical protein [Bermanella marisrubri]EAT13531.1 hypothetical protein RED65_09074 [Oceanobacter sp. RED65] [Bermanella marisrubri]QIZ84329.1 hypothetical protein HF888_08830 [Bermanella marisrubri]